MKFFSWLKRKPMDPGTLEQDLERAIHSNSPRFILSVADRIMTYEGDTIRYHALMNRHYRLTHDGQLLKTRDDLDAMAQLFDFLFHE